MNINNITSTKSSIINRKIVHTLISHSAKLHLEGTPKRCPMDVLIWFSM